MKDRLVHFTKILLDAAFYIGIPVTAAVPYLVIAVAHIPFMTSVYWGVTLIMMTSGVFALLIFSELRKIFRTVVAGDCFRRENVTSLSRMGWYSFAISLVYVIRMFIYPTPSALVIIIVFVIAGLFSKVLSRVFDQAVTYKIENDLTI